jgi:putative addiction module component (TIGR02574 family)
MFTTIEAFEAEALGLPQMDRARLVEKLILSLEADPGVESAWQLEVERRATAIERGEAKWLAGPETLAAIKAEFQ